MEDKNLLKILHFEQAFTHEDMLSFLNDFNQKYGVHLKYHKGLLKKYDFLYYDFIDLNDATLDHVFLLSGEYMKISIERKEREWEEEKRKDPNFNRPFYF
jgi:hypothetical protein